MNTLWGWGRASWAGCGPDVRRGGQTLIMGYSADKSPLIGHLAGPLRRLEPLGAQRQEKCGPNRPTPTGYSCNNALIGVHVKTLRSAARDGRLPVTYDTRTTFRHLRARATPAAAQQFRHAYYGRAVKPVDRRAPLTWASVPADYDAQIRALRRARGLSQAQLATLVGAARKAVVYQWEARTRTPSPLFWQRITALRR